MAGPSGFRLDGSQFFCTWPRTGEAWDSDEFFKWLEEQWGLVWCRLANESHKDGEPHVHAAFKLRRRLQSTNCRVFDYKGHHGHYEVLRSPAAAAKYFEKESFVDYGRLPGTIGKNPAVRECIAIADGDELEYFTKCAEVRLPYPYACHFRKLLKKSDHTIEEDYEADITRERFDVCIQTFEEGKSTCIIGPTGCGKTSWAKRVAPKPALWVRHMDTLGAFRKGYHKSIIFDDMSFLHLPRETQLYVADTSDENQIHIRYGRAILPAGVTRIFTANYQPFVDDVAINRRVRYIRLD